MPLANIDFAMEWCAAWCALDLDGKYENPNPVQKVLKDMLDPGGLVTTSGPL